MNISLLITRSIAFTVIASVLAMIGQEGAIAQSSSDTGLTPEQLQKLRSLGVPIVLPKSIQGEFTVSSVNVKVNKSAVAGKNYEVIYRNRENACFEMRYTSGGIGGISYDYGAYVSNSILGQTLLTFGNRPSESRKPSDEGVNQSYPILLTEWSSLKSDPRGGFYGILSIPKEMNCARGLTPREAVIIYESLSVIGESIPKVQNSTDSPSYPSQKKIDAILEEARRRHQSCTDRRSCPKNPDKSVPTNGGEYRAAWMKVDPSIARFLGSWYVGDEFLLDICPSKIKGKVCVLSGGGGAAVFGFGEVDGKTLRYQDISSYDVDRYINRSNEPKQELFAITKPDLLISGKMLAFATSFASEPFSQYHRRFHQRLLDEGQCTTGLPEGTIATKPTEQLKPIAPGGSYAYPSPEEFAQFKRELKQSPVSLSAADRKARQDFQAEWQKKNRAIAPYVGAWKTADNQDVYVFPSKVAGRVCVLRSKDGKLSPDLGVSMTTDMRYDGNNGLFKVDTLEVVAGRSSKTQPLSAFYGAIGSPDVSSIKGEFEQAQCISELPKGGAIVAKKPLLISPDSRNPINSTIQPQSITLAPKGSSSNSSASSSILPSDPKTSSNLNRWFTPLSPNETDLSKWFTPSSLPTDAEIRAQLIQTLRGNQFLSPGMYNSLYSHQPLNIVFGKYQERTITKAKTEIEMDFYNFGILGGTLEVYDSSGNLKSIKFFEGKENIATDFANFYIESGKITLKQFTEKNGALAIAKKSKIEPFEVVDGDFVVITKESKIAQIYNYVGVFVDLLDASTSAFNMGDKKSGLGLLRTKDGRIGFSREFISQLAKQSASTSKETLEITLNDLLVKLAKTELPDFIASIKNGEKLDKALQNKPTLSNLFNSALAASKNGLNSTEFKESLAKAGLNATISGLADISGASMLLDSAFIFSKSTDIFSRVNQLRRIEVSSTKGLKLQNLTTKIFSGDGIVYDSSSIKAVRWWSDGSYEVIKELPLVEKEILDEGGIKGEMRIYSDGNTRYIERFIEKTNRGANS